MKATAKFTLILWLAFIGIVIQVTGQEPTKSPNSWTVAASYTLSGRASGLAWDGTYIYYGIQGVYGDQVYKFNLGNGVSTLQCTGTFGDSYGLTYKSPNLVNTDHVLSSSVPAIAIEFNMSGTTISTLDLPAHYISGIAYDAGNYWVCAYYPDPGTVYKINSSGVVLSQFTPPNDQPWDICLHGSDLWIADYSGDMLYKVTTTGTVLESHDSENTDPAGIVWDGSYLWYCDGAIGTNSTLYKIDLDGSGTPAITVPVTSHDYGNVTIGNTSSWSCQVQNTGTANLTISNIGIPGGQPITTTFTPPQTITPGNSTTIPLTYAPITATTLNTQVTISSNDPINPTVNVTLTGNGVYGGPHITLPYSSHDWGDRRAGAYSRWQLPITNDGDALLTISALNMSNPNFFVDESVVLPMTVMSTGTGYIPIWFHPEAGTDYDGTLTIVSDATGQTSLDVDLEGSGIETDYPIGTLLWNFQITGSYDNSPKAIMPIQDITGDDVDDVLVGSEDNFVRCFNGNASVTGDVMWATEIPGGSVYSQKCIMTIDDIDGDGYHDAIIGTAWGDRSIIALSGKTGLQLWKHDTHEYGGGGWVYQVDVNYDYNNDGFPDVLAVTGNDGGNTGPVRTYCLNGLDGISIWESPNPDLGPLFSVIGVEDFTGDGQPDAVAGGSIQNETSARVFGIDGSDGSVVWSNFPMGSSTWGVMQLDDINGDGIKDVAIGGFGGQIALVNAVNGVNLEVLNTGSFIINRLQDMGDVNKDGYRDILVAHSSDQGIIVNGLTGDYIWNVPLLDQSSNVGNIGDITWDGINDAIIGTLFQSNYAYFLDGWDGSTLASKPTSDPVDAINSIPDIVGDTSMEMVLGTRQGMVACLSGGYDTTSVGIPVIRTQSAQKIVTAYPNPFQNQLTIQFILEEQMPVKLELYDFTGRFVALLQEATYPAGTHTYLWSRAGSIHTGMFMLKATIGSQQQWVKLIVK